MDKPADTAPRPAAAKTGRHALTYPYDAGPEIGGDALEIAAGVLWLRMPLEGSLEFINVWAIADGEGWAIVDTGMGGPDTQAGWKVAFAGALKSRPVTRVFVTHLHPDHIGMAGWLTRKFGCRLWITRLEYLLCRNLANDTGREAPAEGVAFYRAAGLSEDSLEDYRARFGGFGRFIQALPDSFKRLSDGDEILIGDHVWRVVVGSGHSPEHACLYCPELKLAITGDQILPKISSNVSVFPTEPDADPLTDWLTSLARIKERIPDGVLALPAHNEPFYGLHARIDRLIEGHERSLERLARRLAKPARVADVFSTLFMREINADNVLLATGESLAHLNCLIRRGQAVRSRDEGGVDWYQAA